MSDDKAKSARWGVSTQGIRAHAVQSEFAEHSPAIFATSSFTFDSAEQAAAAFDEREDRYIYSRFDNPTVHAFEQRLAALEGAESGVATASGMAAILSVCQTFLKQGDHVVAASGLFGSTIGLLNNYVAKFGIEISYVAPADTAAWATAMQPNTRLLLCESPTNPLTEIVDIAALADLAHAQDALLVVDNCFCTPALQRPIEMGADIVVHSATKFLDGQGRCIGGAVLGNADLVGKQVYAYMRSAGPCMSPFNAWVFLKGLETLELRMQAHAQRALQIAQWLQAHAAVGRVFYTGLESHPQHALACKQQSGHGAIVAFELRAGQEAAFALINACELVSITANLGDARTTITHPATTTHHRIGPQARARAGIGDGLVRLSVGLENVEDLIADLERGLG
ncbi:Cys/Met metabolism pyridoxal-phosphate-dependent enzyme [Oceanococcus atlanticus]|uniref:O-succinylhomoserine sulfhydrylase n=1 Tax=Oceanococcus atlanticus TaxID=1317117 RepID=A0A1Y1SCX1_9GAMM|nr:O-succinylhomoserine sulfhydrylase [Oceanococcus atlanticus]ORE86034.1 Cys/Met metabolism pyridoxal-phosphate-dependent enzyme [Oceanococcus atlanticus]